MLSSIISVTELVRQLRSRKLSDNFFYKNESALVGSFFISTTELFARYTVGANSVRLHISPDNFMIFVHSLYFHKPCRASSPTVLNLYKF